ncbi:MAG: hypothetical protein K6T85_14540, partial [Gorillibacterium sp.]|nr:hypothetical protein [Gorillibacterium sp.]
MGSSYRPEDKASYIQTLKRAGASSIVEKDHNLIVNERYIFSLNNSYWRDLVNQGKAGRGINELAAQIKIDALEGDYVRNEN